MVFPQEFLITQPWLSDTIIKSIDEKLMAKPRRMILPRMIKIPMTTGCSVKLCKEQQPDSQDHLCHYQNHH